MYVGIRVNYSIFLSHFDKTLIFSTVSKNIQISNFMEIRPEGAELSHAERHTDGRTCRR
jgi:hypothetical protein